MNTATVRFSVSGSATVPVALVGVPPTRHSLANSLFDPPQPGVEDANLGNFLRQAVLPRAVRHWTLTTLREKLIRIGAKDKACKSMQKGQSQENAHAGRGQEIKWEIPSEYR
jgi:hypothetical protein